MGEESAVPLPRSAAPPARAELERGRDSCLETVPQEPLLSELDAGALHRRALAAFRAGNLARLEFIRTLRLLAESRRYFSLGFPSIVAYSTHFFGYRRSETYEALRVAEGIERLPALERAFAEGSISWSALRHLSRITTAASEARWLAFAVGRSVEEVRAEVEHAVEEGREGPREQRFGLPDLKVRVVIEMKRSEEEVLRAALERIGGEMRHSLGHSGSGSDSSGVSISVKDALLHLAERVLATAPGAPFSAGPGNPEPTRTILYHVCPECRRAAIETAHGRVEIDPAAVARFEESARREVIDGEEGVASGVEAGSGVAPAGAPGAEQRDARGATGGASGEGGDGDGSGAEWAGDSDRGAAAGGIDGGDARSGPCAESGGADDQDRIRRIPGEEATGRGGGPAPGDSACAPRRETAVVTPAGPGNEADTAGSVAEGEPDPSPESARADSVSAIDRTTPPSLRRQVLLRDGRRCANPSCQRRAEHCHHIVWRSRGGRTSLRNETAVCRRCHALIHAGLLHVEGDPALGLRWRTPGVP